MFPEIIIGSESTIENVFGGNNFMLQRIIQTPADFTLTLLRVVLGLTISAHAAQKVFGWFGGSGFSATVDVFGGLGIPAPLAVVAIIVETASCLGLVTGLFSRLSGLGIISIMIGAIVFLVGPNGYFMNWFGQMGAGMEGYEYHLLAIAMALTIVIRGGGALSIDRVLSEKSSS